MKRNLKIAKLNYVLQGPWSNFEIGEGGEGGGGGAPLVPQYWGDTRDFFLLILYNFKNIGGHLPPPPPTPRSLYWLQLCDIT